MTSTRGEQDFAQVWLAFVQAIQELLDMARQRTDQPQLTPYEGWEGEVLTATRDNQLVQGLQLRWQNLQWDSPVTANLLLQELRLFPGVVERIRDRIWHGRSRLKLPLIKKGLSIAKTGLGSVFDLFEHLPITIKGPLKVLEELLDIVKGSSGE